MPDPDAYLRTAPWQRIREQKLKINPMCETPGCRQRGVVVDHIRSRRDGGSNAMSNLRTLCLSCDAQIKEFPGGKRRNGGVARPKGCGLDGW
jgi:5-methylcytosine-specific restriction endonuclease McrA